MKLLKRSDSYWTKRAEERLTLAEQKSEPYLKQALQVYEEAKLDVVDDLRKMYAAYHKDDEGFNKIALNSIVSRNDIRKFRDEMKQRGLSTKLPDNYNGRITRLELFEAQLQAKVDQIGLKQNQIEGTAHRNTVESGYYHSIYDLSKGIGVTPAFSRIDERTINKILETKFEGKNYSQRIWGNTNVLAEQLREKLAKAIATGQSIDKTAREFRERFGVSESYAKRLIRTETCYFENAAEIESYKEMGIEYYVFVAVRDDRTSEICSETDGEKFKVKEAMAGVNLPPMHPNCRSTIRAYLGEEYEPEIMIYRDPETGRNEYTSNMSYKEWYKKFVGGAFRIVDGKKVEYLDKYVGAGRIDGKEFLPQLAAQERTFYEDFAEFGETVQIIPKDIPKDGFGAVPTNDFVWYRDGQEWELKTSKTLKYKTVAGYIRDAVKRGKKNLLIDVHEKKSVNKLLKQLLLYNSRNLHNQADKIYVFTKDGILKLVEK